MVVADVSGQFTGKPRPAVIIQADAFTERATITICPITSVEVGASRFRLAIEPSDDLRLNRASWIEVDLITTVRRNRVRDASIGRLSREELARLSAAIAVYLGIG